MTSLVDIAKRRSVVQVQGAEVPVKAISAEGLVYLIERFPSLQELIFPGSTTPPTEPAPPVSDEEAGARLERAVARRKAGKPIAEAAPPPQARVSIFDMLQKFPEPLGAILAAGTGHLGDKDEELAARDLGADDQIALLEKIMELTMPRGVTAFLERLTDLMGADVSRQLQRSANEPPPSNAVPNGRAPDTPSPTA